MTWLQLYEIIVGEYKYKTGMDSLSWLVEEEDYARPANTTKVKRYGISLIPIGLWLNHPKWIPIEQFGTS